MAGDAKVTRGVAADRIVPATERVTRTRPAAALPTSLSRKAEPGKEALLAEPRRRKTMPPNQELDTGDLYDEARADKDEGMDLTGGLGALAFGGDKDAALLLGSLKTLFKKKSAERQQRMDKEITEKICKVIEVFNTVTQAIESGIDDNVATLKRKFDELEDDSSQHVARLKHDFDKFQTVALAVLESLDRNYTASVKIARAFEKEAAELQLSQQAELGAFNQQISREIASYKASASALTKDSKTQDQLKQSLLGLLAL